MLLTFVWDKTASGTVRSKTFVLLLTVPETVSPHTKARSRSAIQSTNFKQNLCLAPRCPRGSLVPYNSEEQISFNSFHAPGCPRGSLVPYKSEENQCPDGIDPYWNSSQFWKICIRSSTNLVLGQIRPLVLKKTKLKIKANQAKVSITLFFPGFSMSG